MTAEVPCEHPENAMRQAMLYDPEEAFVCTACSSMVFADHHTEPVGITGVRTAKR